MLLNRNFTTNLHNYGFRSNQEYMRKVKKNLLLIGGTGRNVGKTTLANEIIKKFSPQQRIIGLKVSTFRKNENQFHGDHQMPSETGFLITKEDLRLKHKDTATMVLAGAERAYYVQTTGDVIMKAYREFEKTENKEGLPLICESRGLISYIKPGLFLMIVDQENMKDDSIKYIKYADRILYYKNGDLSNLMDLINDLSITNEGWALKSQK